MNRLLVQPYIDTVSAYIAFAEREDLYFEISEVCDSRLNRKEQWDLAYRYQDALGTQMIERVVAFHGAFMDLMVCSPDIYIAQASRARVSEALEISALFTPEYLIFHSSLLPPLATYDGYERAWVANNADYWRAVVEQTDSTILMENMFDESPAAIAALVDAVDSRRFQACLNIGHANAFSRVQIETWFDILGERLIYCHMSDNDGTWDASEPPGRGTVDWATVSEAARRSTAPPDVLMGIAHRGIGAVDEGIRFLRGGNHYPFPSPTIEIANFST